MGQELLEMGFSDVEAVIKSDTGKFKGYGSPVNYLWKYLVKSFDVKENAELIQDKNIKDLPPKRRVALYTHLWNKIMLSRDIYVSKAFKDKLNNFPQTTKEKESGWELQSVTHLPLFYQTNPSDSPDFHRLNDGREVIPPD